MTISFPVDLQQRRVPAVLELQAGLQPALQEARLKAEQAAHIFTQVNNDKILNAIFPIMPSPQADEHVRPWITNDRKSDDI